MVYFAPFPKPHNKPTKHRPHLIQISLSGKTQALRFFRTTLRPVDCTLRE